MVDARGKLRVGRSRRRRYVVAGEGARTDDGRGLWRGRGERRWEVVYPVRVMTAGLAVYCGSCLFPRCVDEGIILVTCEVLGPLCIGDARYS